MSELIGMPVEKKDAFDLLLDDVLRGVAMVEAPAGLGARVVACAAVTIHGSEGRHGASAGPALVAFPMRMFATVDKVAEGRRSRSMGYATMAHVAAILLIGVVLAKEAQIHAPVKAVELTDLRVPPIAPVRSNAIGGGGGQHDLSPVTKGTPPKFAEVQIVPPKAPPLEQPKIVMEPTIEVQKDVKMASVLPQIGVANSALAGLSMGTGRGTGVGSGNGPGMGPGSGGDTGGGPRQVGSGVSAPVLTYSVEPEFSEEARRAKVEGNVIVNLWVDEKGNPSHVRAVGGVGMGLDEKAVEAVKQYRFKPASLNGKPVLVELNIEVIFRIL